MISLRKAFAVSRVATQAAQVTSSKPRVSQRKTTFAKLAPTRSSIRMSHHAAASQSGSHLYSWDESGRRVIGAVDGPVNANTPALFTPLKIRELTLKNRTVVSPMCMYSCNDGFMTDFHLVHLGQFALGGVGLIIQEATAVAPEGRITPHDADMAMQKRIVDFVHENSGKIGIQLAHAGRKASTIAPFLKGHNSVQDSQGGWTPVGASAIPWDEDYRMPHELTKDEIKRIVHDFALATKRAAEAGYDVVEIHGAHGYLITSFYSPLSNKRTDEYGGSFENRIRLLLEVTKAVRDAWPAEKPLFVRLSCTEWAEGGWTLEDTLKVVPLLKKLGVDLIDSSSAGNVSHQKIQVGPGFQVPFAKAIKEQTGMLTGAVGLITDAEQAEAILKKNEADLILMAREYLRDPHWPLRAAHQLGVNVSFAPQYERARRAVKPKL